MADVKLPLLSHLVELRRRLLWSLAGLAAASAAGYLAVDSVLALLTRPAQGLQLVLLSPPEAFGITLKIAGATGFVLALPFIMYQMYAFVLPALKVAERRILLPATALSGILFVSGVVFCYFWVLPWGLDFFLRFAKGDLVPLFSVSRYLEFVISFLFAFGAVFLLPVLLWLLGKAGIVSSVSLRRGRKYAVLLLFTAAAVLTPPDVVSQVVMALPLLVLYEMSILLLRLAGR